MTILELPGTSYRLLKPIVAEVEHDAAGFVISEQSTGVFYYDADFSKVPAGFVEAFVNNSSFSSGISTIFRPTLNPSWNAFSNCSRLR